MRHNSILDMKLNAIKKLIFENQMQNQRNKIKEFIKQNTFTDTTGSEYVQLRQLGVTDKIVKVLITVPFNNLTELVLCRNQISNEGLKHLCKADWKNIRMLDLHWNNFSSEGVISIVKGSWINVQSLYLSGNNLGQVGLQQLTRGNWNNLKQLGLTCVVFVGDDQRNSSIEAKMLIILAKKFPTAQIMF